MQQQVIIQLGDPTLLKASKSLLPSIRITVGSFGTCLYAENINHTQGSNLSLPPQWVVSMQVVLLVLAVPQPFGLLGVCGQKCHVGWSSSHRFVSDFLLSWTVKFVWEGQDVLLHSVKCQVFRPNHREVQTRPRNSCLICFTFTFCFSLKMICDVWIAWPKYLQPPSDSNPYQASKDVAGGSRSYYTRVHCIIWVVGFGALAALAFHQWRGKRASRQLRVLNETVSGGCFCVWNGLDEWMVLLFGMMTFAPFSHNSGRCVYLYASQNIW